LAADWRGLGLASRLIERAVRELFQSTQIQRVVAHVKPDNAGSIRAFEAAGFRPQGCVQIKGCEALELVQARPAR
jgi:RimJ/RimL family protein N-acetyltransferase